MNWMVLHSTKLVNFVTVLPETELRKKKKRMKLAEQLIIDLNDISLISLESINLNKSKFLNITACQFERTHIHCHFVWSNVMKMD